MWELVPLGGPLRDTKPVVRAASAGRTLAAGILGVLISRRTARRLLRFSHLVPRSSDVRTSAAAAIAPIRWGQRVTRSRARQWPSRALPRSAGARSAVISWL